MNNSNSKKILDEFQCELRALCLEPHTEKPNPVEDGIIYHYTSAEGLIGILGTGTLWATNLWSLEDPKEVRYPHEFCRDFFRRIGCDSPAQTSPILMHARQVFDDVLQNLFSYECQFSVSFTLEPDMASQWQQYADQGRGFAIGFDSLALLGQFRADCPDPESTSIPYSTLWRMIYKREKQVALLNSLVQHTLKRWPHLSQLESPDGHSLENHVASRLVMYSALASTCLKDTTFSKEREIRAMYANALELKTAGTQLDMQFRSRRGQLVGFRNLNLKDRDDRLPIRRIVIGPANDPVRASVPLRQLLSMHGLSGDACPEIVPSQVSPCLMAMHKLRTWLN